MQLASHWVPACFATNTWPDTFRLLLQVATGYAIMKETDYMNKPKFLSNFWAGFRKVLGSKHEIQDLKKCDFTPIYDHLMAEREAKKTQSKEVGQTPNYCSDSS